MTVRSELEQQLVLSRAAESARRGDLDQAAAVLDGLDEAGPEVLDLLARIAPQQK
ncbi:hypothetical protein ACGFIF_14465 [Kribbella sp. NPDC049174]|uniref:hypothetical protein n=1 Tax=Kribbella sp. NPDC049174 TaxID=3364112 RepID=UPI00372185DE